MRVPVWALLTPHLSPASEKWRRRPPRPQSCSATLQSAKSYPHSPEREMAAPLSRAAVLGLPALRYVASVLNPKCATQNPLSFRANGAPNVFPGSPKSDSCSLRRSSRAVSQNLRLFFDELQPHHAWHSILNDCGPREKCLPGLHRRSRTSPVHVHQFILHSHS